MDADSSLALLIKLLGERCLTHVGREGSASAPFHLKPSIAFSFPVHIGKPGKPYERLASGIYPTGPAVSGRAFVGRTELLRRLADIWAMPDSKDAVVLIGQTRIGKSSILNFIEGCGGLQGTDLLPARINAQEMQSTYSLLQDIASAMARAAGVPDVLLDRQEPSVGLTRFARGLPPALGSRRILLMIDEADSLQQIVGSSGLGLLRSLMQDHAYPLVFLFCGTHALRRMTPKNQSLFFNTAHLERVTYMSKEESAEVLRKPVGDGLDFDPAAVAEAYRITAGQPYLLGTLGNLIVEALNKELSDCRNPDNFIDLHDVERAALEAATRDNLAFADHWNRCAAQRQLLSGLAKVHDIDEAGTTMPDIGRLLEDLGIPISRSTLAADLEFLVEEEHLAREVEEGHLSRESAIESATYRFRVPLFKQWIAASHTPLAVRVALPLPR